MTPPSWPGAPTQPDRPSSSREARSETEWWPTLPCSPNSPSERPTELEAKKTEGRKSMTEGKHQLEDKVSQSKMS